VIDDLDEDGEYTARKSRAVLLDTLGLGEFNLDEILDSIDRLGADHAGFVPDFDRGLVALAQRNVSTALVNLQRAYSVSGFEPALFMLGLAHELNNDSVSAAAAYDSILQFNEYNIPARSAKALLLLGSGNDLDALLSIHQALEVHPESAMLWYTRARINANIDRFDVALDNIVRACVYSPDVPAYHQLKGELYFKLEDIDAAFDCFDRCIELAPRNPDYWHNKGGIYFGLKRYAEAQSVYSEAVQSNPDDIAIHYALALSADQNDDLITARVHYEFVLERNSHHVLALFHYGTVLSQLEEYAKAVDCFDQAVFHDSDQKLDDEIFYFWGEALIMLGRFAEVHNVADNLLRVKPESVGAYMLKGDAYLGSGDRQNALVTYQEALRKNPDDEQRLVIEDSLRSLDD